MEAILIILGVLGFGAIVIAAYVFTVAARNYVSDNDHPMRNEGEPSSKPPFIQRQPAERRSNSVVQFPLMVNGVLIPEDRRKNPDRRLSA